MTKLQQLRERLDKGFYVDNLYEMVRICKSLALETSSPTPFFVMRQIFLNIANYWEDRPVIVEEAKLVEVEIIKPMMNLIETIEAKGSNDQIYNFLNRTISSYMFLFPTR